MEKLITLFALCLIPCSYGQAPDTEWQHTYGGNLRESVGAIIPTNDGGYITVGITQSNEGELINNHGNGDIWIVKLDSAGQILWQKALGGSQGEFGRDILQTSDGGYMVAGMSASNDGDVSGGHGNADCWLAKLDGEGNIEWQKAYGGSEFDEAISIKQAPDGGYVFLGTTYSNNGDIVGNHSEDGDLWVVKVSASGDILWKKTLGGIYLEIPWEIIVTADNGYVIASATESADGDITNFHGVPDESIFDIWILKLTETGSIDWQKCYGGTGSEVVCSIQQTNDGGYVFTAEPDSSDGDVSEAPQTTDIWIVKTSSTGDIQWQNMYGGSNLELLPIIRTTPDSGYIVLSQTQSNDGDITENHGMCDMWATKLNNVGILQWQKTFGGEFCDYPQSIEIAFDGGYILGGELSLTDTWGGDTDMLIVKLAPESLGTDTLEHPFFTIYPNPGKDEIKIRANNQDTGFDQITCRDLTGKIVANSSNTDTLNIRELALGLYTIEITSGNEIYSTKFIKN